MGYYTDYELKVHEGDKTISEILAVEKDFRGLEHAIDENGYTVDCAKWYEHEDDMEELSLKYPDIVFALYGTGEESGDLWCKYFKNGKIQQGRTEIVFQEFDEKLLT